MGQFRQMTEVVQRFLSELGATQKLLIGSLVVLMAMTLFVVRQYSATPELVPLISSASLEEQGEVTAYLDSNGVEYTLKGGQVMVPADRRHSLLGQLTQQGKMPSDNSLLFDDLVGKQSWTKTYQQNQQLSMVARQNELSRVISQMRGISRATVIMDIPTRRSLGQADRQPTASVTVFAAGGVNQVTVDAIANLVASSTAGLDLSDVRVIDGTTNRQFSARADDEMFGGDYQERVLQTEREFHRKLEDNLSYIPNVIVSVHAQVDNQRVQIQRSEVLPEDAGSLTLPLSTQSESRREEDSSSGGSPGIRSNTGANVASVSGGPGSLMTDDSESTTRTAKFGSEVRSTIDSRGHAMKVNAVVNIPRSYVVEVWKQQAGEEAAEEPDDAVLKPVLDKITVDVEESVKLLIDSSMKEGGTEGEVKVSMIPVLPDMLLMSPGAAGANAGGMFAPGGAMGEMVKSIAVGGLAVVSLGLVLLTAMRANKREDLPSASELVGIPPALQGDSDIVGEAGEADSVLAGVELSEDDLKVREMLDQISSLVGDQPDAAARLITRWVEEQD